MKYQWLEDKDDQTCEELSKELGCKVKSIAKGGIIVGYQEGIAYDGGKAQLPIVKQGIEIELENETPEMLEKLDAKFTSLKREGGYSVAQELADLKARIGTLEKEKTV